MTLYNLTNKMVIGLSDSVICLNAEQVRLFTPVVEAQKLAVVMFVAGMAWGYFLNWYSNRGEDGDT